MQEKTVSQNEHTRIRYSAISLVHRSTKLNRKYTLEEALNDRLEGYDLGKINTVVIILKHHEPLDRMILYSGADEATVLSIASDHGIPMIPSCTTGRD